MDTPLQITFRGFPHNPELDHFIREHAAELEPVAGNHMSSCRVVLELGHQHLAQPRVFHAQIEVTLPGGTISVNREAGDQHPHEDPYVALRDAFDVARRQITDWERRRHGDT